MYAFPPVAVGRCMTASDESDQKPMDSEADDSVDKISGTAASFTSYS
jgi:hypothetical protein